ncbi:MAG: dihydroorotate dehydrogenase-like protein [Rectinema sp.]
MADLTTNYVGLKLANPIIVAASGMTGSPEGVEKAVAAGPGAIVLKSLFEEQILAEIGHDEEGLDLDAYPEGEAFLRRTGWEKGAGEYIRLVEEAKKIAGDLPVFASINCVGAGNWAGFAKSIELAGASGIELNVAFMPFDVGPSSKDIEDKVLSTIREVRAVTKLPIAVKVGQYYSSLPHLARALSKEGANALVLFNRFFRFDIDTIAMKLKSAQALSSPADYHESLRWVSVLFQRAGIELTAATGIHDAETAIKMTLAGAGTVQVCSVLYRKGWNAVSEITRGMDEWLDSHGQPSLEGILGKLSARNAEKPQEYLRLQYIKALTGIY